MDEHEKTKALAYQIAEQSGFRKPDRDCWHEAKRQLGYPPRVHVFRVRADPDRSASRDDP